MKNTICSLIALSTLAFSSTSFAALKTYQVTGPILEVTPTTIVVQKGKEKWELAKDATTKGADVKVGDKVTVKYTMTAVEVDAKAKAGASHTKTE